MNILKLLAKILVAVVGVGLVILGQNGRLLDMFDIARNTWQNLCLELFGLALILGDLYVYNRKYSKDDIKAKKKAKKKA